MHRTNYKLLFVTLLLGLLGSNVSAEERIVVDNVLISPSEPGLAIRVGKSFNYVGVHDFDIRGIAGGTRHVWLDEVDGTVRRLFIVQLEGYYPGNGGQYHYDLSKSPEVAGYRWRSNGFAFDLTESRRETPDNESSITAEFLTSRGYKLPELILMWRSLTVVNEARTHEAILFLMESGDRHGPGLGDIYHEDEGTELWKTIQIRMEQDFHELIELSPLDAAGDNAGAWDRIPIQTAQ